MKLIRLFLFPSLLSLAIAATLAPDLPDGVYQSYTDEQGVEHHMQIYSGLDSSSFTPLSWTYDPTSPNATLSSAQNPFFPNADSGIQLEKRSCSSDPGAADLTYCGCGFTVDHGDCDAAVANLKNQVANGATVQPQMSYYAIRGSVVAFICSYSSSPVPVTVGLITTAAGHITDRCGLYIAGTYESLIAPNDLAGYNIGYMQYYSGLNFCSAAVGSTSTCCN